LWMITSTTSVILPHFITGAKVLDHALADPLI